MTSESKAKRAGSKSAYGVYSEVGTLSYTLRPSSKPAGIDTTLEKKPFVDVVAVAAATA